MKQLKIKKPKLKIPNFNKSSGCVCGGLYTRINNEITNRAHLRDGLISSFRNNNLVTSVLSDNKHEKVISAGRGGAVCGKKSAMAQIADGAVKRTCKKREIIPYRPQNPQMHTLKSLDCMKLHFGKNYG